MPSPRDVKTYDQKPEMSAREVTDKLVRRARHRAVRLRRWSTSPTPTWSATPASWRRRSRRCRWWTSASAGSGRRRSAAGHGHAHHRRPRQLRDDDRPGDRASRTPPTPSTRCPSSWPTPTSAAPSCAPRACWPTWPPPRCRSWGCRSPRR